MGGCGQAAIPAVQVGIRGGCWSRSGSRAGDFSPPHLPQHPPLAPVPGWLPGGCPGGGSGSRAAASPRGRRDSLGQTADAGAEVSQAGWLPEPDIFGKFQQKQFRSFQKTG